MKLRIKIPSLALVIALGAVVAQTGSAQTPADDPYQVIQKREFGTAMKEMEAIEKEIQDSKPDQYPAIESRLIAIIESSESTIEKNSGVGQ